MFLLLLIAVLVGWQQLAGHRPVGQAVLCPLWRKAPGTKRLRVGPLSLFISGEEVRDGEISVTKYGVCVVWHARRF